MTRTLTALAAALALTLSACGSDASVENGRAELIAFHSDRVEGICGPAAAQAFRAQAAGQTAAQIARNADRALRTCPTAANPSAETDGVDLSEPQT